ncbi:MAG: hypothetical protein ACI9MJ_002403 [Alphaproteobacteria bacterium]
MLALDDAALVKIGVHPFMSFMARLQIEREQKKA